MHVFNHGFSYATHFWHNQWRKQKISRGGQVSSQSCDVTNQLKGKCRRQNHSRGIQRHAPGKVCKITPKNTHFCAFWKQVLDNTVSLRTLVGIILPVSKLLQKKELDIFAVIELIDSALDILRQNRSNCENVFHKIFDQQVRS